MNTGAGIALMILFVATRPLEVRLWRAGRLSDRALAILILVRFPLVGLAAGVLAGASLPVIILLFALMSIPAIVGYGWALRRIQEAARELPERRPVDSR